MIEKIIKLKILDDKSNIIAEDITETFKQIMEEFEKLKEKKKFENEYLTNEDVAKLLKIKPKSVCQLRYLGKFPAWTYTKIPGVGYRFKRKELLKYLGLDK